MVIRARQPLTAGKLALLLGVLLLGFASAGFAQEKKAPPKGFSGWDLTTRIVDENNRPISNAMVYLRDGKCECKKCSDPKKCDCCPDTDDEMTKDGVAVFSKLATGTYVVHVTRAGYSDVTTEVKVVAGKDTEKVVQLKSVKQ